LHLEALAAIIIRQLIAADEEALLSFAQALLHRLTHCQTEALCWRTTRRVAHSVIQARCYCCALKFEERDTEICGAHLKPSQERLAYTTEACVG